jgi:uncharacterized protein involved in copper resistance
VTDEEEEFEDAKDTVACRNEDSDKDNATEVDGSETATITTIDHQKDNSKMDEPEPEHSGMADVSLVHMSCFGVTGIM